MVWDEFPIHAGTGMEMGISSDHRSKPADCYRMFVVLQKEKVAVGQYYNSYMGNKTIEYYNANAQGFASSTITADMLPDLVQGNAFPYKFLYLISRFSRHILVHR